jgi:hypothetical protein
MYYVTFSTRTVRYGDRPWLDIDGYYTTGLGDHTLLFPPNTQINYLNIVVRIGYYPYYLPFRQYKLFGFRSWRGTTDDKLYWRDYTPDPIPLSGRYRFSSLVDHFFFTLEGRSLEFARS